MYSLSGKPVIVLVIALFSALTTNDSHLEPSVISEQIGDSSPSLLDAQVHVHLPGSPGDCCNDFTSTSEYYAKSSISPIPSFDDSSWVIEPMAPGTDAAKSMDMKETFQIESSSSRSQAGESAEGVREDGDYLEGDSEDVDSDRRSIEPTDQASDATEYSHRHTETLHQLPTSICSGDQVPLLWNSIYVPNVIQDLAPIHHRLVPPPTQRGFTLEELNSILGGKCFLPGLWENEDASPSPLATLWWALQRELNPSMPSRPGYHGAGLCVTGAEDYVFRFDCPPGGVPVFVTESSPDTYIYIGHYSMPCHSDTIDRDRMLEVIPPEAQRYWAEKCYYMIQDLRHLLWPPPSPKSITQASIPRSMEMPPLPEYLRLRRFDGPLQERISDHNQLFTGILPKYASTESAQLKKVKENQSYFGLPSPITHGQMGSKQQAEVLKSGIESYFRSGILLLASKWRRSLRSKSLTHFIR